MFEVGVSGDVVNAPLDRCVDIAHGSSIIDLLPTYRGTNEHGANQDSTRSVS
jgi:hypothetical protein